MLEKTLYTSPGAFAGATHKTTCFCKYMYVANPALAGDISISDFKVLVFQQHVFSGGDGFLFRNTKIKFSQIQVMIKEA